MLGFRLHMYDKNHVQYRNQDERLRTWRQIQFIVRNAFPGLDPDTLSIDLVKKIYYIMRKQYGLIQRKLNSGHWFRPNLTEYNLEILESLDYLKNFSPRVAGFHNV